MLESSEGIPPKQIWAFKNIKKVCRTSIFLPKTRPSSSPLPCKKVYFLTLLLKKYLILRIVQHSSKIQMVQFLFIL